VQHNVDTYEPTETETAAICPGKCNSAFRAAERSYNASGTDHDFQPCEGRPVWCPPCTTAIRSAIADWPDLAARLVEEIESGVSAGMSEYVSGSKNRPVHDHEKASFLLDEFAEWISGWEATIRAERRLNARRSTADPCAAITNACLFLLANLDWHLAGRIDEQQYDIPVEQIIEDFGLDLLHLHRRAQDATGTRDVEPVRVIGVPCPICDCKALEHEVETEAGRRQRVTKFMYDADGEVHNHLRPRPVKLTETVLAPMQGAATGYIRCRRCRPTFRMSPAEYVTWTRMLAASERTRALATKEKLAEIFGNSVPTQYRAAK
jgi:hypothetical protein